ncbi:MAG TPA: uroporphyrinogen-III C-methyltransferase, partial [bacterium]|nr:uroporphyrinogen-III C-methyltransferase [bacterium]
MTETAHGIGVVWLVGTGPGDPDLITLKGLRCIAEADVIVHDRLIPHVLLNHAKEKCVLIDVGKRPDHHTLQQEQINELLADQAAQGKRVCRLKGGDPLVFGRGSEEALFLAERGIGFEIVPAVTAGVGALAYAGIPLTHRQIASCAAFITGHEDPTKPESAIAWEALASFPGTLVFYMGVRHLQQLTANLIQYGLSPSTPAAVIENGTTPRQKVLVADLASLARRAEQQQFRPPSLIVVGEVVALRREMSWFEKRPLFGKTILVTRSREQASELVARLAELGAEVFQAPAIGIESLAQTTPMREAAASLEDFDWIVFTSPNAVDAFWGALRLERRDARAFAAVKVASIGPSTAERLLQHGIVSDLLPEHFVSE